MIQFFLICRLQRNNKLLLQNIAIIETNSANESIIELNHVKTQTEKQNKFSF